MKNILVKKFLIKTFLIVIAILISISVGLYVNTKNRWKNYLTEEEIELLVEEINSSEPLPKNFLDVYNMTKSFKLKRNFNQYLIALIFNSTESNSQPICFDVVRRISPPVKTNSTLESIQYSASLTWQIENRTTNENCLNWYLKKFDFANNQIGVENASVFYFNKPINHLDENEIIGLIVMLDNPILYNPIRRPELFESRIEQLKKLHTTKAISNTSFSGYAAISG